MKVKALQRKLTKLIELATQQGRPDLVGEFTTVQWLLDTEAELLDARASMGLNSIDLERHNEIMARLGKLSLPCGQRECCVRQKTAGCKMAGPECVLH